jgi:D-glycero-alpha-D-manno-heptose 1-phosphate guanylyltransferase
MSAVGSSLPPCIILAGGLGTRLRSVVADQPKCLAPVGSRTFLEIQLELLASRGVERFVLSLGYLADAVIEAIAPLNAKCQVDWVVEASALGTGGAVLNALEQTNIEEALVTNGDTWLDASLRAFQPLLNTKVGELMRMAVVNMPDRGRYGGPIVATDGIVNGFDHKGAVGPGLINAGLYRLHRKAFGSRLPGAAFSLEADVMAGLVPQRAVRATTVSGAFIDIGVPEDYRRFCELHS